MSPKHRMPVNFTNVTLCSLLSTSALAFGACGDSVAESESNAGSATQITSATNGTSVTNSGSSAGESESGSATTGAGSGSASMSSGSAGTSESASASATSEGSTGGFKLDVAGPDTGVGGDCGCEFSYVWVANSPEGTVSKINMVTLEEEARYLTRADGKGDPSRTSVSLSGDVAVANRAGGLVKFWAEASDCVESNGIPGIQTSTGKDDVLPWDEEECRAWYRDFEEITTNQRPVAWAQGFVTPGTCDSSNEKVWTVMSATKSFIPSLGGPGGVFVHLIDGETGQTEKEIEIKTFPGDNLGAYGGAVNAHGDLYFTSMAFGAGKLARVNIDNFTYQIWDIPGDVGPYGITVDHYGKVWLSSISIGGSGAARFDPDTEEWDLVSGFLTGAGIAEGPDNQMWVASEQGVNSIDMDTLALGPVFKSEHSIRGVGFDHEGNLWGVSWVGEDEMGSAVAVKVDTGSLQIIGLYDGLDKPYTYSDFTGNALGNVTCPPPQ